MKLVVSIKHYRTHTSEGLPQTMSDELLNSLNPFMNHSVRVCVWVWVGVRVRGVVVPSINSRIIIWCSGTSHLFRGSSVTSPPAHLFIQVLRYFLISNT
jgi:hypothetical protein